MPKAGQREKHFTPQNRLFSTLARNAADVGAQRTRELQSQKMIVVQVRDPDRLSPHAREEFGKPVEGQWEHLESPVKSTPIWQRPPNDNQSAPGRNVDGRGKLQRILAILVATADKNGDGKL